ncbi:endolytic transglycosylase MltG [Deinococcus irradiatisoli]|uniref:Endolytic murein transglycosylase n=1 Tax=Deinococcus irradiatisoli TaxID=2202254 RepID=A0A2Z3JMF0_9DEIO|nr:endolytic transglycosylase MltG [Deinococcus irradiatisoli]AWN22404.1 endolytic transglycosylase MltG [Deinococcus irradiatisoli]
MTRLRPRRPAWQRALFWIVFLLLLLLVAAAGYLYSLTQSPGGPAYTLEVQPGDTLAAKASELQQKGVIKNADVLRLIMRQRGTAGKLKEGLYDIPAAQSAFQVADDLAGNPRIPTVTVTIPEGLRLKDIPPIFVAANLSNAADLKAAMNDVSLSPAAKAGGAGNLEGFLFPATYPFRLKASGKEIVAALVERMNQEFTSDRVAQAKALGLSIYDWVTLASMVQAEAANSAEMPVVAGVFLNRLRDGIALGSDPTVAYGLGKDLPDLDRSAGDFTKDTPYSTYTRMGLPKGPINNPGQAALLSILNAKRTTANGKAALYFLHGTDGQIHVNNDYAAHQRDILRYR